MRRTLVMFAFLATSGAAAAANEGMELSARSKSMAAASAIAANPGGDAPFRARRDPLPELLLRAEQEQRGPRGACQHNATALCYDLADGRIVYRPARRYMPSIDGMKAESISLRRDRIVLKYSFR